VGELSTHAAPGREVIAATRPFASENRFKSWWVLWTTLIVVVGLLTTAAIAPWWPLSLAASLAGGLVMVRGFILVHDYKHGAILRNSWIAKIILHTYSMIFLSGPTYWRDTHNYHHANVSTVEASSHGSFPIMTLAMWRKAGKLERLHYRIARHPMTILLAYITVFLISNSTEAFIRNPKKNWGAGASVLVHAGLIVGLWLIGGFWVAFWAFLLPYTFAAALGAYLFYVQHNFRGMQILPKEKWSIFEASMKSTSYFKTNRVLDWCFGSIGFHHIHHINPVIPFYRLRETMKAIPALQTVTVTTFKPRDVWDSLRQKIWDETQGRMLTFREARRAAKAAA
jgi:omega-6 fatty acid desaturase (delta-12 desaturase)